MSSPKKPTTMNGDHAALWGYIQHLNTRIDKLFVILTIGAVGEVGIIVGIVEILR